jgi:hypothetical protein
MKSGVRMTEIVAFSDAVAHAYTFYEMSERLAGLDQKLRNVIPLNAAFPDQVRELVVTANRRGWI